MILPTTYATGLFVMILALLGWGLWASTFKLTRKWRFELYYLDFVLGLLVAAVVAAFTFGSMGEEITFEDNLLIAGKRQMAYAVAAGIVFNLGNLLLTAAFSISGLAVAFSLAFPVALIVACLWTIFPVAPGNIFLSGAGIVLLLAAIGVTIAAYRASAEVQGEITARFSVKAVVLALCSGLFLGSYEPLIEFSRFSDIGLGPYSVAFFFAVGATLSTLIFNLYFMNLPVQGQPVGFVDYFRGSLRNHSLGWLGGILWGMGAVAAFVAFAAPAVANPGPVLRYGLASASILMNVLLGLVVWKEFPRAEGRVRMLLALMVILLASAISLMAVALAPAATP